ncbi:putative GPI-anchored protein pfl2 [Papaver somniferum]|uniref:putative GPI-anchored protein pfl2 n=1 Tax=Papaver somniferum TaxID=3469 RepID=UPI000E6FED97|nr:putative GPI-anchored protein pfl2 [Papaver somniferum]
MGCFISKFRPKKIPPPSSPKDHQSCHSVQDKLVILSQVHPTPPPPLTVINTTTSFSKRINPIPTISSPSYTSTSASSSATTGSTVITNSTCSTSPLSSSCSSSIMSSRERSFSNEFLWSCIKENPHLIQVTDDPDVKMTSRENNSFSKKFEPPNKSSTLPAPVVKQQASNYLPPKKHTEHQSIPQRRPPPSSCGYSPVISRQKSFRRSELPQPCPEKNYNNNLVPASRTTNASPLTRRINSSATYYSHSSPLRGRNANGDTTSKAISRNSSPLRNRDTNVDTRKATSRGSSPNWKYNNHNVPIHDRYYYPASPSSSSSSSVRHNNKENFPMPRSQRFNKSCELQKWETASCATSRRVCPLNDHAADGNGHEDIRNSPSSSSVLGEVIHSHQEYLDSIHQIDDDDDDDDDQGLDNPHISLDCFIFL